MSRSLEHWIDRFVNLHVTRRDCLCLFMAIPGLCLVTSHSTVGALPQAAHRSILDEFLGEELTYHIGFWFLPRCGEARTSFSETEDRGLYRASLEGRTLGVVDLLVGRYRYSYASHFELSPAGDRLRPRRFQLTKKRLGKESWRTTTFDYSGKEITFSRTAEKGELQERRIPMKEGIIYEDYLTLFYNFRHGVYGPMERGRTYHLPLHIHEGMNAVNLSIASLDEEEKRRQKETDKARKDFFLRFRVNREDVSSTSGEIEGWLSFDGVPVKGTIRNVILFGDLWGELTHRQVGVALRQKKP